MLGAPVIMDVLREGIWAAFLASLPVLSVALIVGLGVGLFQALTSVQEMTLTFVPKLAAIAVTFWISMGWMTEMFVALWRDRLIPLIGGG
jgi:flagellar biosynthesis protein FliQ